jgi:peptide/nickel transport system substrate-binding protein
VRLDVWSRRSKVARAIQEDLAEIGVRVDINAVDNQALYALAEAGESDFYLFGWDCGSGEATELLEMVLHTPTGRLGLGNFGTYSNPRIDEIAQTNGAMLDPAKRKRGLQQAAEIVMHDLPILPLYVGDDTYGVREHLRMRPRADALLRLEELRLVGARSGS